MVITNSESKAHHKRLQISAEIWGNTSAASHGGDRFVPVRIGKYGALVNNWPLVEFKVSEENDGVRLLCNDIWQFYWYIKHWEMGFYDAWKLLNEENYWRAPVVTDQTAVKGLRVLLTSISLVCTRLPPVVELTNLKISQGSGRDVEILANLEIMFWF